MTRARAPTDRAVAARLGKLPRTVWGRFAAHFKRLTHCNAVRATASPLQNVRAACATKATPAASKLSTAKSRTGRARRTRRRGAIPVWVFECALTAAALAIAAEGLRYVPTDKSYETYQRERQKRQYKQQSSSKQGKHSDKSKRHTFYIQAQIRQDILPRTLIDKIGASVRWFDLSQYPPHITLVKVRCPVEKKAAVSRYLNETVKQDVQTVINGVKCLTFRINSVATEFGRGQNTVAAKCDKLYLLNNKLEAKVRTWKKRHSQVSWRVEDTFHITLGSYKTQQAHQKSVDDIREAFENELNNRTYGHNDLLPVSLANL